MKNKILINDIRHNALETFATWFFLSVSVFSFGLTCLLFVSLLGSIDSLTNKAKTPDFLQMHTGDIDEAQISKFVSDRDDVSDYQIIEFLNLENNSIKLSNKSLSENTQDNGVCVQSENFDFLIDMDNEVAKVNPGEVYVPVCYKNMYDVVPGDSFEVYDIKLSVKGFIRDSQMNSMMASSKRFLVSDEDYKKLCQYGSNEYLIEFKLIPGADISKFSNDYADSSLPKNGPAITASLIKLMSALSDGLMIAVILLISVVIVIISLICIRFILITALIRQNKEIGLMKAVGIGRKDIRSQFEYKFIILSLIAAFTGLILTYIVSIPLSKSMRELYGICENRGSVFIYTLLTVFIVLFICFMSIRKEIKKTENISVVSALYDTNNAKKTKSQYALIAAVILASVFLMVIPENLLKTISSPDFVTYMGIGNGEIRFDIRQTEDIINKSNEVEKLLLSDGQVNKTVSLKTKALSSLNSKELEIGIDDYVEIENGDKLLVTGIYSDITNGGKTAKGVMDDDQIDNEVLWSIFYISLNDGIDAGEWVEKNHHLYDKYSDIVNINDYMMGTYGPTINAISLAATFSKVITASIMFVVISLFVRLLVEKERLQISLKKAIGISSKMVRRELIKKLKVYPVIGIILGIIAGCYLGQFIAGMFLESLGASGFKFVIDYINLFIFIPGMVALIFIIAAACGTYEIDKISACEVAIHE